MWLYSANLLVAEYLANTKVSQETTTMKVAGQCSLWAMSSLCIRKARSGNVLVNRQFEQQAKIKQSSAREDPAAAPWYYFTKEGQPSPLHWMQLSLGVSIFSSVSEVGFSCGFSCFLLIFYISLGEWPAFHLIKAISKLWSKEKNVLILWPF